MLKLINEKIFAFERSKIQTGWKFTLLLKGVLKKRIRIDVPTVFCDQLFTTYFTTLVRGPDEPVIQAGLGLPDVMDTVPYDEKTDIPKLIKLRSLFPETWLWDIVSIGWVGVAVVLPEDLL